MPVPPITIITPCYNENVAVIKFLEILESVLVPIARPFRIIVVNDCSTDNTLQLLHQYKVKAPDVKLDILNLRFNVGHQAAIYQGMLYAATTDSEQFIIMDSDGEDAPSAIPELITHPGTDMVHVVRGKRKESTLFKVSYGIYKIIFKTVTGKRMNYGNYCMISRKILDSAVYNTFTHFAAFLSKQRGTRAYIVAAREKRLDGKSKMSFKGLLSHAFKSFVEYGEDMLLIFLKSFLVIVALFILAISNVIYQKFVANTAILGWTSVVAIGLLNMAIITIGFFVLGILLLNISNQKNPNLKLPLYDEVEHKRNEEQ